MNRFRWVAGRCLVASCIPLLLAAAPSRAAPGFDASYSGSLTSRLDWSSDLGVALVNVTPTTLATGAPLAQSASAVRAGREIRTEITQVAPYVLGGDTWAASWTGSMDVPGPGFYGLFATSSVQGVWNFAIPGQTFAQNQATTFHYASQWEVVGPAAIHPLFTAQFLSSPPLSGSSIGSFTLGNLASFGISGFPMRPSFGAATFSLDTNPPGHVDFIYRIAFSKTPIDSSVFAAAVPEPEIYLTIAVGLALTGWAARRRKSGAA